MVPITLLDARPIYLGGVTATSRRATALHLQERHRAVNGAVVTQLLEGIDVDPHAIADMHRITGAHQLGNLRSLQLEAKMHECLL